MSEDLGIINEFLGYLPKIDFPKDLKERAIKFLNQYAQAHHPWVLEVEEKIEKDKEYVKELEGEQQHIRGLACQLRNKK